VCDPCPTALYYLPRLSTSGKKISRRHRCVRRAKPGILTESMPNVSLRNMHAEILTRPAGRTRIRKGRGHSANPAMSMHMADTSMAGMEMEVLPLPQTPWAVGATHVPHSTADAADATIPLDKVIALGAPSGRQGWLRHRVADHCRRRVHRVVLSADPEAERTLHMDRYSSQILTMLIVWISDRLLFSPGKVVDTR
jgi:hypothetical protein